MRDDLVRLAIGRELTGWVLLVMAGGSGDVVDRQPTKAAILKAHTRARKAFQGDVALRHRLLADIARSLRGRSGGGQI